MQLFYLVAAVLLVLLNGFFVAAEFAMVKLRQTQVQTIKQDHAWRGKILARVHHQLDAYLSACQLGITLASLGLGWIGEPAFAALLTPALHLFGIFSAEAIKVSAFLLAFSIISFLHIVVGELAPKSLAIRLPTTVSLWTAAPLYVFYWAMYPAIWLLNYSANLILRLLGSQAGHKAEGNYSSKEIKLILKASHRHGELKEEQADILQQVIDFAERRVADCVQPAEEMVCLDLNKSLEANLKIIKRYRFSRYPVFSPQGQIVGIILVKDLFFTLQTQGELIDLQTLIRPVLKIEPDLPASALMQKFRAGAAHFAIVENAEDSILGFVTLDDILMTLLGYISDEFTKPAPDWKIAKDGSLLMKGSTPLYIVARALKIEIAEQEINTLSGLIMTKLDRLPELHEEVDFAQFSVKIMQMRGPRLQAVKVYRKQ